MKKTLSILLVAVMLCGVMAGCGGGNADAGGNAVGGGKSSETEKWMYATYAVLTAVNDGDFNSLGGFKKNSVNEAIVQKLLTDWWSVTDRATADDNLKWILEEGHRTVFVEEMADIESEGLLDVTPEEFKDAFNDDVSQDIVTCYYEMVSTYKEKGPKAIDGWDYSRAMQLLGNYYVAGYYTEAEALDKSLEIAQMIQTEFSSWDEFVMSYMYGYQYWQEEPFGGDSSVAKRMTTYNELKNGKNNPYGISWDTKLEKTW